jgi:putative sterol carrier protein
MATSAEISSIFPAMVERFNADKAGDLDAMIQFELSGDNGGNYWVKISGGQCESGTGTAENPQMTVKATADDFHSLFTGQTNPMQAFMMGKLKVSDMGLGMKMTQIFGL